MQASHCLAARPSLVPCAPGTLFVASALAINIYVSGAMRAPCRAMCSMVIRIWFVVLRRRDVMESRIAAAVRKLGIARWISEWSLYRPVYSRCSGCLFLSLQYHGALQLGFRGFVDFLWFPAVSTAEFLFILLWLRYDAGYWWLLFFVHPLRFVSTLGGVLGSRDGVDMERWFDVESVGSEGAARWKSNGWDRGR